MNIKIVFVSLFFVGCTNSVNGMLSSNKSKIQSVINPLEVSHWYIDAQSIVKDSGGNSCASDSNDCTESTCTVAGDGTGPCLSYNELVKRWGTEEAKFKQTTIVTLLSDLPGDQPISWRPRPVAGASALVEGALGSHQLIGGCSLSSIVNKDRSSNQLMQVSLPCGPFTQGQLMVNTTHPSEAWIYKVVSGAYVLEQPLKPTSVSPLTFGFNEVDNWQIGDDINVYSLVNATVQEIESHNLSGTCVGISHLRTDPNLFTSLTVSGDFYPALLTVSLPYVVNVYTSMIADNCTMMNEAGFSGGIASFNGNIRGSVDEGVNGITWLGGAMLADEFTGIVDDDSIIFGGNGYLQANIGSTYVDTGTFITLTGNSEVIALPEFDNLSEVWGPGGPIISQGLVRYQIPSTQSFSLTGGIRIGNYSEANTNDSSTVYFNRVLNAVTLGTSVSSGGFGDNAYIEGVGSFHSL